MPHQQQSSGGASVLLAFIAGAAVGAAVALLFAPAPGMETREAVSRRAREGRDRMLEALRQGRGIIDARKADVVTAFERARQQAQGMRDPEREA
jgi:gas vesicle protein